jgi:hypothetical protein
MKGTTVWGVVQQKFNNVLGKHTASFFRVWVSQTRNQQEAGTKKSSRALFASCFFVVLLFNTETEGSTFFQNTSKLLPDYIVF